MNDAAQKQIDKRNKQTKMEKGKEKTKDDSEKGVKERGKKGTEGRKNIIKNT
jgi:hypothetical protein